MFDGVDETPAFIDHFILIKSDGFIQLGPPRIKKTTHLH